MAHAAWAPPQPRVLQTYVSRLLVVQGPGIAALLLTMLTRGRPGVMGLGTWRWWVQGPRTTDAQAPSSINGRSPE